MPIYEFMCVECENIFEQIFTSSGDDTEISCPKCKSQSFERVVSMTNFAMGLGPEGKQAKITTKSCSGSNECMTLDLPGHSK